MRLGDLAHDRQAEARAGLRAPLRAAEEAVEELPSSASGDPGPWSRTSSAPSRSATSTTPPGGLNAAALSSTLLTARPSRSGTPAIDARLELGPEADAGAWRRARATASATSASRRHVLDRRVALVAAGQLDEVAHEPAELLGLADHVAQQRAPLALLELGAGEQDLHVGPQRGHRRAQLVRGVGHELALGGLRGLHAIEHRVEALRHPADLVLAARADAPPEVAGGLDVLGRARELGDRAG